MAIKRENKFDEDIAKLDREEAAVKEKSEEAVKRIVGNASASNTRVVVDKNGRKREIKVVEKRKTLPVYIPESLYEQFDAITTAYGKSNNSAIVELIRDYVTEKKSVLNEI